MAPRSFGQGLRCSVETLLAPPPSAAANARPCLSCCFKSPLSKQALTKAGCTLTRSFLPSAQPSPRRRKLPHGIWQLGGFLSCCWGMKKSINSWRERLRQQIARSTAGRICLGLSPSAASQGSRPGLCPLPGTRPPPREPALPAPCDVPRLPPVMANVTVDEFSCYEPSVVGYRYVAVTWGVVVIVAGTLGNVLTLLAFVADSKLQTRFNLLIVNLTLADLLYCAVLQPFSVDSYLHLHWRAGPSFCRVFGMLLFVSNSVSILTLCLIAVSRYVLIANPALFNRVFSRLGMGLVVLATWAVGFASFAPLWPVFVLVPKVCTCSFHRIKGRPYTTILMAFYFVVGLSCVGIFYFLIHRKVKGASRNMDRYKLKKASRKGVQVAGASLATPGRIEELDSGVDTGVSQPSSGSEQGHTSKTMVTENSSAASPVAQATAGPKSQPSQPKDSNKEFRKVTRMCFVVFLFFVISYIPFLLLNIFDAKNQAPTVLHMVAANLTWLNSCINPVLYAAMNRHFREAYQHVLATVPCRFRCC
ncbi:LOW QUALITY PROTEIN: G-protein coupled receptor 84 [Emydura macquarii macquarii]|uniref:LOW QUALITY PROTEIN: G-protein coupled receptor 84 n=1 Tax=Emydura macquarii macquarii TaxID=1129001 RepID=UPI00352B2788